jgi:hypothetical protein
MQGGIEVTGKQGRRRRKLLDDFKERREYSHLKKEALDRTMWRARFARGFGPVVRQTAKWMNEINSYIATQRGICGRGKGNVYSRTVHEGLEEVELYTFFNFDARCGWVVNATPRPLYPRERPSTHSIGGWVDPSAGLDKCEKSRPHRDSIPGPPSL